MGQTLTHGVYLPDEGERNCYAGLAANWQILDTSVGTIAEHTSALSGKAPLVHTHTKSDITDFPVYGTTAGTICEGNDSRLSDARTPVAHTHGKADITDLFNSDFIPSANNSYDLGSSSYQWNNLYAKNYYYNGVAWGLDKANTWSNINKYQREICISGDRDAYIAPMWESASSGIAFLNSDVTKTFVFGQYTTDANNRKAIDGTKGRLLIRTGERNGETAVDFEPRAANAILGTSTNPFKTLNGINPGGLSLPDLSRKSSISEYITNLTGGLQYYTPAANGWICIQTDNSSASNYIRCTYDNVLVKANGNGQAQGLSVLIPVLAGVQVGIRVVCTSLSSAYFYHCQGNVS